METKVYTFYVTASRTETAVALLYDYCKAVEKFECPMYLGDRSREWLKVELTGDQYQLSYQHQRIQSALTVGFQSEDPRDIYRADLAKDVAQDEMKTSFSDAAARATTLGAIARVRKAWQDLVLAQGRYKNRSWMPSTNTNLVVQTKLDAAEKRIKQDAIAKQEADLRRRLAGKLYLHHHLGLLNERTLVIEPISVIKCPVLGSLSVLEQPSGSTAFTALLKHQDNSLTTGLIRALEAHMAEPDQSLSSLSGTTVGYRRFVLNGVVSSEVQWLLYMPLRALRARDLAEPTAERYTGDQVKSLFRDKLLTKR